MRIGLQKSGSNETHCRDIDLQTVREIFARASKEVSEDQKLKSLREDTLDLLRLVGEIKDKLGKIIDEPWKV